MTNWIVIRKATDEDYEAVERAACRFAIRHQIKMGFCRTWLEAVEFHIDREIEISKSYWPDNSGKYIKMLWKRCMNRALGTTDADGFAWDTVGKRE